MTSTSQKNIVRISVAAVFAALICVMTGFICRIPWGVNGGYIHLGDALIFLAASVLPTPFAMCAAGIGGGLADILCGAPVWAPFTVVIKALMALVITNKSEKIVSKRNMISLVPCAAISIVGYFIGAVVISLISGSRFDAAWGGAAAAILGNVIQAVGSSIVYFILAIALDKTGFKKQCDRVMG